MENRKKQLALLVLCSALVLPVNGQAQTPSPSYGKSNSSSAYSGAKNTPRTNSGFRGSTFNRYKTRNSGTSFLMRNKPVWLQRLQNRRQNQWDKPPGVKFHQKAQKRITPVDREMKAHRLAYKSQRNSRFRFTSRMRTAWKARWKNRFIDDHRRSPTGFNAGFGRMVIRSVPRVRFSWRFRQMTARRRLPNLHRSPAF